MNTRFNPTANGPCHIGHIYMAKLNEHLAHSTGGTFTIRIDDDQPVHLVTLGQEKMSAYARQQVSELSWAGIKYDRVTFQSQYADSARVFLAQTRFQVCPDPPQAASTFTMPNVKLPGIRIDPFPLASQLVAEKVVYDYWENMTACIRGPELLQEHQFYMYLCSIFGFRWPDLYYYPRLVSKDGSTISKTAGNWQVSDFQCPEQLWDILRHACLVNPQDDWSLDNIKNCPIIKGENNVLR